MLARKDAWRSCSPVPCSKQCQPGLVHKHWAWHFQSKKKTSELCHASVVEAPQTLNYMHLGQWLWMHSMQKSIADDVNLFTIFPYHNFISLTFLHSHNSHQNWGTGHLLQLQFLFADSSRAEFCLVTLFLHRNRHYFRMTLKCHFMVIH